MVIDHLAKPRIKEHRTDDWLPHFRAAAAFPNVSCKLSGMVTEADWRAWTVDDLKPYVRAALELFGPGRLHVRLRLARLRAGGLLRAACTTPWSKPSARWASRSATRSSAAPRPDSTGSPTDPTRSPDSHPESMSGPLCGPKPSTSPRFRSAQRSLRRSLIKRIRSHFSRAGRRSPQPIGRHAGLLGDLPQDVRE